MGSRVENIRVFIPITRAEGLQRPLAKEVVDLGRARLHPPRAALHVGLPGVSGAPRCPGAVIQEAVCVHHLRVALLTATHSALQETQRVCNGFRGRLNH